MIRWILLCAASLATAAAGVEGTVATDDGRSPEGAAVQLICPEGPAADARADASGRFKLPEGDSNCVVTARLSGYVPASDTVARMPLDPRIPGLLLRRQGKWQGQAVSATILSPISATK